MKQLTLAGILLGMVAVACAQSGQSSISGIIRSSLNTAEEQYRLMDASLPDSLFPRTTTGNGQLVTNRSDWWTSGFYPGSLWYLYEYSHKDFFKRRALLRTNAVKKEQYNANDHDIGFKINCSFGNAWRLTHNPEDKSVIITAAKTLSKRFDPTVGCIRSWGSIHDNKSYLVIIDNMMNLELLFEATHLSGDSSFFRIAVSHADKTMANHFRPDGSSYHVVEYDPQTGKVIKKRTAQGYADESAWARGQAWGLYGFTVAYRETGFKRYLDQANKIARFILKNPHLPADKIPYWDFNAPDIPHALRDASAGAVMASALLELSRYVDKDKKKWYIDNARDMIRSLSKAPYRATVGENGNFLIKHNVGNEPAHSEVDVPLSYGDYYYLEAMMRYREWVK